MGQARPHRVPLGPPSQAWQEASPQPGSKGWASSSCIPDPDPGDQPWGWPGVVSQCPCLAFLQLPRERQAVHKCRDLKAMICSLTCFPPSDFAHISICALDCGAAGALRSSCLRGANGALLDHPGYLPISWAGWAVSSLLWGQLHTPHLLLSAKERWCQRDAGRGKSSSCLK